MNLYCDATKVYIMRSPTACYIQLSDRELPSKYFDPLKNKCVVIFYLFLVHLRIDLRFIFASNKRRLTLSYLRNVVGSSKKIPVNGPHSQASICERSGRDCNWTRRG